MTAPNKEQENVKSAVWMLAIAVGVVALLWMLGPIVEGLLFAVFLPLTAIFLVLTKRLYIEDTLGDAGDEPLPEATSR